MDDWENIDMIPFFDDLISKGCQPQILRSLARGLKHDDKDRVDFLLKCNLSSEAILSFFSLERYPYSFYTYGEVTLDTKQKKMLAECILNSDRLDKLDMIDVFLRWPFDDLDNIIHLIETNNNIPEEFKKEVYKRILVKICQGPSHVELKNKILNKYQDFKDIPEVYFSIFKDKCKKDKKFFEEYQIRLGLDLENQAVFVLTAKGVKSVDAAIKVIKESPVEYIFNCARSVTWTTQNPFRLPILLNDAALAQKLYGAASETQRVALIKDLLERDPKCSPDVLNLFFKVDVNNLSDQEVEKIPADLRNLFLEIRAYQAPQYEKNIFEFLLKEREKLENTHDPNRFFNKIKKFNELNTKEYATAYECQRALYEMQELFGNDFVFSQAYIIMLANKFSQNSKFSATEKFEMMCIIQDFIEKNRLKESSLDGEAIISLCTGRGLFSDNQLRLPLLLNDSVVAQKLYGAVSKVEKQHSLIMDLLEKDPKCSPDVLRLFFNVDVKNLSDEQMKKIPADIANLFLEVQAYKAPRDEKHIFEFLLKEREKLNNLLSVASFNKKIQKFNEFNSKDYATIEECDKDLNEIEKLFGLFKFSEEYIIKRADKFLPNDKLSPTEQIEMISKVQDFVDKNLLDKSTLEEEVIKYLLNLDKSKSKLQGLSPDQVFQRAQKLEFVLRIYTIGSRRLYLKNLDSLDQEAVKKEISNIFEFNWQYMDGIQIGRHLWTELMPAEVVKVKMKQKMGEISVVIESEIPKGLLEMHGPVFNAILNLNKGGFKESQPVTSSKKVKTDFQGGEREVEVKTYSLELDADEIGLEDVESLNIFVRYMSGEKIEDDVFLDHYFDLLRLVKLYQSPYLLQKLVQIFYPKGDRFDESTQKILHSQFEDISFLNNLKGYISDKDFSKKMEGLQFHRLVTDIEPAGAPSNSHLFQELAAPLIVQLVCENKNPRQLFTLRDKIKICYSDEQSLEILRKAFIGKYEEYKRWAASDDVNVEVTVLIEDYINSKLKLSEFAFDAKVDAYKLAKRYQIRGLEALLFDDILENHTVSDQLVAYGEFSDVKSEAHKNKLLDSFKSKWQNFSVRDKIYLYLVTEYDNLSELREQVVQDLIINCKNFTRDEKKALIAEAKAFKNKALLLAAMNVISIDDLEDPTLRISAEDRKLRTPAEKERAFVEAKATNDKSLLMAAINAFTDAELKDFYITHKISKEDLALRKK
jgi:hypothetical protein